MTNWTKELDAVEWEFFEANARGIWWIVCSDELLCSDWLMCE